MFRHKTVLVVDDEPGPRQALQMILKRRYNVLTCDDPQKAMELVSSGEVDVVMLDIKMPGMDGLELLKVMKQSATDVEIALITGYPSMQSAIEAMQQGAYDYVIKPFDKDRVEQVVRQGVIRRSQRKVEKDFSSHLISEVFNKFSQKKPS